MLKNDEIDTRNFQGAAVSMLRGGSSIEKNLRRTYRKGLKSTNSISEPIFISDTLSACTATGDNNTVSSNTVVSLSSENNLDGREIFNDFDPKPILQMKSKKVSSENNKTTDPVIFFAKKCWEEFQKYSFNANKIPLSITEYEFPSKHLRVAVRALSKYSRMPSHEQKMLDFIPESNTLISWKEFRHIMFNIFNIASTLKCSLSGILPTESVSSYSGLLQQQKSLSSTAPSEVPTAFEVEQSASVVRLKGKIIPSRVLKEAFVKVVAEDYSQSKELAKEEFNKSEIENSFTSSFRNSDSVSYSDSIGSTDSDNFNTYNPRNLLGKQFSEPLQKQRVLELLDPREEYGHKWELMKKQRDARTQREFKKRLRFSMINSVAKVVLNAERHEIADAYSRFDEENRKATRLLKQDSQQRIDLCHENTRVRNMKEQQRKQTESRYLKDTISHSVTTFRSIVDEENELRKLNRDHCITELDPCTSTKVDIPDSLILKMKNAKSQKAFDEARFEIQRYYETTLSRRIAAYTAGKEYVSQHDLTFGSPIKAKARSRTSFSDSSISPSEDLTHMSSLFGRISQAKSAAVFNYENSLSADSAETERTIHAEQAAEESSWNDDQDVPVSISTANYKSVKQSKPASSPFRYSSPHSVIIR